MFLNEKEINFINTKIEHDILKYEICSMRRGMPDKIENDSVYKLENEKEEPFYIIKNKKYDKDFIEIKGINQKTIISYVEFKKFFMVKKKKLNYIKLYFLF